jgi:hypothetical protein
MLLLMVLYYIITHAILSDELIFFLDARKIKKGPKENLDNQ